MAGSYNKQSSFDLPAGRQACTNSSCGELLIKTFEHADTEKKQPHPTRAFTGTK